jgi:hypothetical protein
VALHVVGGYVFASGTYTGLGLTGLADQALAVQGGGTWAALAQALADVQTVGTAHLLLLTNDADLVDALTPPIRAPAPTATRREYFAPIGANDFGFSGTIEAMSASCRL